LFWIYDAGGGGMFAVSPLGRSPSAGFVHRIVPRRRWSPVAGDGAESVIV
jgi:hypothetical protein